MSRTESAKNRRSRRDQRHLLRNTRTVLPRIWLRQSGSGSSRPLQMKLRHRTEKFGDLRPPWSFCHILGLIPCTERLDTDQSAIVLEVFPDPRRNEPSYPRRLVVRLGTRQISPRQARQNPAECNISGYCSKSFEESRRSARSKATVRSHHQYPRSVFMSGKVGVTGASFRRQRWSHVFGKVVVPCFWQLTPSWPRPDFAVVRR